MKIAIMGCRGQLGRALRIVLNDHDLVCVDVDELDITCFASVVEFIKARSPGLVINAAAYTQVDKAESDADAAFKVNALGPRNLAIATCERKIPLVHISTDYVFDGMLGRPYREYDAPNPLSVYGRSKLAGEQDVRAYNPRHYISRTAWLYYTIGQNFPKTMLGLAAKGEVRVVNDQHGSPTYAGHLALAIKKLMMTEAYGTYHLAGSGGTSWYELTRRLYELMGLRVSVTPVTTREFPRPAVRPKFAVLETVRNPPILLPPWQEGLEEFCREIRRTGGRDSS